MKEESKIGIEQMFDIFTAALEQGDILRDPSMNLRRICGALGLDAEILDKALKEDIGRSGAEIVDSWRGNLSRD